MARLLAEEVLDEEVASLAGERYSRKEDGNPFRRWGSNSGSIRIDGEKVPIDVPRVRDTDAGEERSLESYQAMRSAEVGPEMVKAILLGLSQGDYQEVAGQFVDGFGLSQSSVSRRFQERAQKALEEFENRSLEEENFLALLTHGKRVAGEQMIICMGVTEKGYKKVLGFTQATSERSEPVIELFRDLIERGLTFEEGILCVIDGSKGLRKAIDEVFGDCAEVQRCQWHNRKGHPELPFGGRPENVAIQAPTGLPGDDLRGRQRAARRSPRRTATDQPPGRSFSSRGSGRDPDAPSARAL
nr:transposase [Salinibacter ruber]